MYVDAAKESMSESFYLAVYWEAKRDDMYVSINSNFSLLNAKTEKHNN